MPKAHQQYFADEVSLEKEARTFQLDDELKQKIDNIDGRAEENVIEIVKVNSVPLPVDSQKAVDVTVPLVQDSLDSTDPSKSLSAKQWKILYDYIVALQSRGRFLSSWNAVTGTPVTEPFGSWYVYNPWDYFVVTTVAPSWGTNYRPDWTVYVSWQASTVVETENVEISDMYIFDWTQWLFQKNTARQIAVDPALSTTSTNPVENRVVTNALNTKQNILTAWSNIQINWNIISATWYSNLPAAQGWTDNTLVTTWDKYNWDHKQDWLTAWANIQINWNVISATDTTYGNYPEAQGWTADTLVTTWDKYNWNHKQDWLTAWANIQINNWVISATDTTYTAWTGISIDSNNVISAHDVNATWWNITWNINNQTDLKNLLDWKQNILTAWNNITINNNVISATDTKYTAWSWITINAYNEIINDKQFDPKNIWQEWQVLKKYSNWTYWWENESWGGWWGGVDNTPYWPTWDWVTWVAPSKNAVYDKISAMDITIAWKQDQLVAWANIQLNWNVISATDTKYTASDFDIKDLADSLNLRNTWNNKQDAITDLNTIRTWAAKWMTALQPWDNVSRLVNDAGYITKAVNDLTNYYNKNQTYTKAEVDALIANFAWFQVVSTLPTTNIKTTVIYLLWPHWNNVYDEYVYINNQWVKIWETSVDLTNYFNKVNDDSDDIIQWSTHLFMTPAERTNLSHQSGTNTWDETQASIQTKLWAATSTKSGYLTSADWNIFNNKQDKLVAWNNIQINWNVISATTGWTYTAWDYISIDSSNVISNTKPFIPSNTWSAWQVLTKTSNWYRRETGSGWWGWVTSVNWRTWAVTVEEFDPDNNWTVWQVLKKTSSWYAWQNESWGWGSFSPENPGSTGQVLTKTSTGYDWETITGWEWNVKLFVLSWTWDTITAQSALDWYNAWKLPIIRLYGTYTYYDSVGNPTTVTWNWDYYPEPTSLNETWKVFFRSIPGSFDNYNNSMSDGVSYQVEFVLRIEYDGQGNVTDVYSTAATNWNTQFISPYIDYTNPYMPIYDGSPATKKYVDQAVAGWGWWWITNNTSGTTTTIQQEWAWSQAEYDALRHAGQLQNWVIYNIFY